MAVSAWLPGDAPLGGHARDTWQDYRSAVMAHARHPPWEPFRDALWREEQAAGDRFCRWLCDWAFERRSCELQYPLVVDLLLPYLVGGALAGRPPLLRWLQQLRLRHMDTVNAAVPALGFFQIDNTAIIKAAIVDDPHDHTAWWMLFDEYLAEAMWGAHHMDGDKLVLPEEQCLRALRDAAEIADDGPPAALGEDDRQELRDLQRTYAEWRAWEDAGRPGRFFAWLEERGGVPPMWTPAHWPSA